MKNRYDSAIYKGITMLMPKHIKIKKEHVSDYKSLVSLLVQIHDNLERLPGQPSIKAIAVLTIARGLNNRVASTFLPEDIGNIKQSTNLQKIALVYCKTSLSIYNRNSLTLQAFQVDDLNYWVNVMDTNLAIISTCGVGVIHKSQEELTKSIFQSINKRVTALIKRNPKPEYLNLQSLLLTYMGLENESRELIAEMLKSNQEVSLGNITKYYHRENRKGKFPVVLYV